MENDFCKNVCSFELNTYMCTACGRTQQEVTEWFIADADRKKEIAKTARARKKFEREDKERIANVPVLDGEWDYVLNAIDGPLK